MLAHRDERFVQDEGGNLVHIGIHVIDGVIQCE